MKIALLAVPFILSGYHLRNAQQTLATVRSSQHEILRLAVVNAIRGGQGDEAWLKQSFDLVEFNDHNNLARAWNRGIRKALELGAHYVLVANLDMRFHPECIDRLVACAIENPKELLWSAGRWHNYGTLAMAELAPRRRPGTVWSCFMTDGRLFDLVGEFDEVFTPAYHEDSDMIRRMDLKGLPRGVIAEDALVYHGELATMKGCLEIENASIRERLQFMVAIRQVVNKNNQLYIRKWGGLPGKERYTVPYNGAAE